MSTASSAAPTATTAVIPSLPDDVHALIPSFPDDVSVNILARVPRSHHPTLSLVSKSFRSLLSSTRLFSERRRLHCAQSSLYLIVRNSSGSLLWFVLYINPNPNPNSPKQHRLVPITPIPSPSPSIGLTFAALGPLIYVLGGSINETGSRSVWVLDCRFHRWYPGPAMRKGRVSAAAGVVGGKVYVIGGFIPRVWSDARWAEVLDPRAGSWAEVSSSSLEVRPAWMRGSAVVDGKIYAMTHREGLVYDVDNEAWERVQSEPRWIGSSCVVDGILYSYNSLGKIRGFEEGVWKELKGMESGLPKFLRGEAMANLGGNLLVVWEGKGDGQEKEVWCAEISVRKDDRGELVGYICWSDPVLQVSYWCSIVNCLVMAL